MITITSILVSLPACQPAAMMGGSSCLSAYTQVTAAMETVKSVGATSLVNYAHFSQPCIAIALAAGMSKTYAFNSTLAVVAAERRNLYGTLTLGPVVWSVNMATENLHRSPVTIATTSAGGIVRVCGSTLTTAAVTL